MGCTAVAVVENGVTTLYVCFVEGHVEEGMKCLINRGVTAGIIKNNSLWL